MVLVAVSMHLSVDFGGSTFDLAQWKGQKIFRMASFERVHLPKEKSETLFKMVPSKILEKQEKIYITGGRSHFFPEKIGNIPIIKVHEIEAIGRGGYYLLQHDDRLKKYRTIPSFLVVSMGTGTCMVKVSKMKSNFLQCQHIGGTGVGGGTFIGLSKLLFQMDDIDQLQKIFAKGNSQKVDLLIGDIIGKKFGTLDPSITASNLGKLSREVDFSSADVAAGIVNLVGQTIASTAVFAALAFDCPLIVLTGKLTKIKKIVSVIRLVSHLYKVPMVVPHNAGYVSALGAGSFGMII